MLIQSLLTPHRESSFYFLITYDDIKSGKRRRRRSGEKSRGEKEGETEREKLHEGKLRKN